MTHYLAKTEHEKKVKLNTKHIRKKNVMALACGNRNG